VRRDSRYAFGEDGFVATRQVRVANIFPLSKQDTQRHGVLSCLFFGEIVGIAQGLWAADSECKLSRELA
jgi:hypothetical protein